MVHYNVMIDLKCNIEKMYQAWYQHKKRSKGVICQKEKRKKEYCENNEINYTDNHNCALSTLLG